MQPVEEPEDKHEYCGHPDCTECFPPDPLRGWKDAEKEKPPNDDPVICYHVPYKRRFVASWNAPLIVSGIGIAPAMWTDEECTHVPVTYWREFPPLPTGVQ
jgi:hypothetical protein